MSEMKKRVAIRLGIVVSKQDIDVETDVVHRDHKANLWGGEYERLEEEEAVLFQNRLLEECEDEYIALMKKGMKVAAAFGFEMVIGDGTPIGKPAGKPTR